MRSPCWRCTQIAEAKRLDDDARRHALATIPQRYRWARIGDPLLAQRVKVAEPIANVAARVNAARTVIFVGGSGVGKTSLACACLAARAPHGRFVSSLTLRSARIQHRAGDGDAAAIDAALDAALLLVDDIGQRPPHATDATLDVIFARHDADRPTWITTGLTGRELGEMYGAGFIRRIVDGALVVKLGEAKP